MPSELADKAIKIVSPVTGDFLAKAKVSTACKLAGTDIDSLDRSLLGEFANKLELACKNLGPNISQGIKEKVLAL